ncbi:MAG TPA: pilus assembly PilX N-terminal domain-containing protein [Candidatus Moranbacteria bacterium]|nr:pilus assembly PilX N-terminal domain-containing protein [Candidatus Moranbacteria bacterium]HRY27513.1 pilus assembly PilX N-terminal domain-containing protein [Candidatus Moranbacteria bacterium]HSA07954.1 pilus assembly PilX N-terminal domain-containing protein [Candidatus Moranbacteria bacterium]
MKSFINTKNTLFCKTKKGSGLVMALVMIVVVSIILTSLLGYITSQVRFSRDRVERERAFQIAEAGIYYYKWYIAHKLSGKKADEIEAFWKATGANCPLGVCDDYEADFSDPEDTVIGKYNLHVDVPEDGSTFFTVTSTGWTSKKPTAQRVLQVRFRRPSWSEYIFLSNSFLNFGTAAVVYGKIHSNFGVHFDGTAYNMVSAMPPSFDDPDFGSHVKDFGVYTTRGTDDPKAPDPWVPGTTPPVRSDVFIGGREMDVSGINFTGITTDLSFMKDKALANVGKYFDNSGVGRKITLKTDGTFDVCTVNAANSSTHAISSSSGYAGVVVGASGSYSGTNGSFCTTGSCCLFGSCPNIQNSRPQRGRCVTKENYPIVNNGVIFVEDNIWLEGSLNGKRVSVVSGNLSGGGDPTDIYIGISNSNIRLAAYDCSNMLGLVAQRDVRVLDDGPSDFIIDAALLAQTGLVGITNGMSGDSITFNGAIASYLQPYFKQGNSGFEDRTYNFNNKLLYCPPPYFPTGTEYSIDQWDEL